MVDHPVGVASPSVGHAATASAVPPTPSVSDIMVRSFERRALARRIESYIVLLVMLALLASAAWVFVQAKAITIGDTRKDIPAIKSKIELKIKQDTDRENAIRKDLFGALTEIFERLGTEAETT